MAPPENSPAYYGFSIIESSLVDGFRLGMITDFEIAPVVRCAESTQR